MGVDTWMVSPSFDARRLCSEFTGLAFGTVADRPVQDDFTLEAWIKTTDVGAGVTPDFFLGNGLIYADIAGVANDSGTSILNSKFAFGVGNPRHHQS